MEEKTALPEAFTTRMKELLGTEYDAFLTSYEADRHYGLRRNPLKDTREQFEEKMPFVLQKISWAEEGYYYQPEEQPGKHVLHEIGAYYIQEPSAMAVVEVLAPKPGERILDLCAAPGGKSTQIAGRMAGQGLLVSNEIISNRAKILAQNVERMGITNCVVCNETPERIARFFPAFFDRIVVDAPCSGEGMFRKDETAVREWSPEHVTMCAERQLSILEQAAQTLKPGGVLVYSTCTFAPAENEGVISIFLDSHPDFMIEKTLQNEAFSSGQPGWIMHPAKGIEDTIRIMPDKAKGEGHYIARLRKQGTLYQEETLPGKGMKKELEVFLKEETGVVENWFSTHKGRIEAFGDQIYLVPEEMIPLKGLKVVRAGLQLATSKKNRLEPAHSLALSLKPEEIQKKWVIGKEEAERFIRGESLSCEGEKGWLLLCYGNYPVGFGKASNGQIKNHYPKGLRK